MRKLTPKEKQLLTILFGLVFAVINLILFTTLRKTIAATETELATLRQDEFQATSLLQEKEIWVQRKQWLDENQPKLESEEADKRRFLDSLMNSAKEHKVTIAESTVHNLNVQTHFQEIGIDIVAKGSLESITRWLNSIQQPNQFQAITNFTLKLDTASTEGKESNTMVCNLSIARWFAPKGT